MGAKHGPPQSSSALTLMHLTCGHYARSRGYHILAMWWMWKSNHRMSSCLPPGHWQTFAALWTYCLHLTTRGPPPCCRCGDLGLPPDWKWPLIRPSHTWLRAVEADLGQQNIGLASAWRKAAIRDDWQRIVATATFPRSMLYKRSKHSHCVTLSIYMYSELINSTVCHSPL